MMLGGSLHLQNVTGTKSSLVHSMPLEVVQLLLNGYILIGDDLDYWLREQGKELKYPEHY